MEAGSRGRDYGSVGHGRAGDPDKTPDKLRAAGVETRALSLGPAFGNVTRAARVGCPIAGAYPGRRGDATCRVADDAAVRVDVPSGTVTFLFTDVEGSTRDEVA